MTMHPTIHALHAADLTPALKLAALALLDAAHPDTGSVTLSRAQALITQGYIIKDGEPVKTMGGRIQRFQLAPGEK